MTNLHTQKLQTKFNYYLKKMSENITKPESRFVHETVLGVLKGQTVTMNKIAIHIQDSVRLKKTLERFRRHFQKHGFWKRLIESHIQSVKSKINKNDYAILDISDIQKKYSRMMEGLARVHDGSTKSIGLGYWLMNIIRINQTGEQITPLYNKLYSFEVDTQSENSEILEGIYTVMKHVGKQLTWVIDRGGDRTKLIVPLLRKRLKFIIRSLGKRKLIYRGKARSIKWISRKVNLQYRLEAQKIKKNRIRKEVYYAGAVPVLFINEYTGLPFPNELWLVVIKGEGKGYSWYIVSTDKKTEREVVEESFRGYGYRWKIEEYHRHIKNQFHLEDIQIRKFEGLRTMLSILTIAMYLIYTEISSLHNQLLLCSPIKTIEKYKLHEILGFIYYKIGLIVKILLAAVTAKMFRPDKKTCYINQNQLALALEF